MSGSRDAVKYLLDRERIERIWRERLKALKDGYSLPYNREREVDQRLLSSALARVRGAGRALDVGSFFPETPRALARRGWTVVCVDLVFECAARARDLGAAEGLRLLAVQCDALALPFRPGVFDLVTDLATSVVTSDAPKVIAGEAVVLRAGGSYVLVSNNRWTLSGSVELRRSREGTHPRWGYFSPMSPLDFMRIARRHRLRLVMLDSTKHARDITGLLRYVLSRLAPPLRRFFGWRIGAVFVK